MSVIDFLASVLNRNDDVPNQDLAVEIIKFNRIDWVQELIENLNNKDKKIQSDCIKTLYEIGERNGAELIAPYYQDFGLLLSSKNNRLVWGAMIALDTITTANPAGVFSLLPSIILCIEKSSVISIDHGVDILAKLSVFAKYSETTFPLLMNQLAKCPAKQLPMYAEKSVVCIGNSNRNLFVDLILSRMEEMDKESQKQRLSKVLKKIT